MLNVGTTGPFYLAVDSQDGRKGIDSLAGVVRTVLGRHLIGEKVRALLRQLGV